MPNYPVHTIASAPEKSKPALEQLRSGAYKPSSIRSYSNYVSALLNVATKSGWVAPLFEVSKEWRNVWDVADAPSSRQIIRFAVKLGKKPNSLSEDDLTAWRLDSHHFLSADVASPLPELVDNCI
jgi:hypothetical protein